MTHQFPMTRVEPTAIKRLTLPGVKAMVCASLILGTVALGANVECPAAKLGPVLDAAYHECSHGFENGSCDRFIETFARLLPKFDCQRSFDIAPVPAVWLLNDAAFEDYVHLLSKMKAKPARKLFGSPEFRDVLDGALAEDYGDLSRRVERANNGHTTR